MDSPISQLAAKRPRSDSAANESLPSPEYIRSAPWFEDGNVILEVERVRFKVYMGILAANSVIFRDMFAVARADKGDDVEGCPVVHLEDNPKQLAYVLDALHDSRKWIEDNDEGKPMPLTILAAFLRIGRKYEIDHIRKKAIQRLAVAFPTELGKCRDTFRQGYAKSISLRHTAGDLLLLINIIRENELLVHLPMAFLKCITRDLKDPKDPAHMSLFFPSLGIQQPILAYKDIELCVKASRTILRLQITDLFSWTQTFYVHGCGSNVCAERRRQLALPLFNPNPNAEHLFYTFNNWNSSWSTRFCQECDTYNRKKFAEAQQKLFDMLPSMFQLPEWDDLRAKWSS
ncbi:hypothetical protein HWV62_18866 [Athelia sp. TMB]|nr:hypothetical protein HWV62_18866 [Athelia sp. TMB]